MVIARYIGEKEDILSEYCLVCLTHLEPSHLQKNYNS